MEWLETSAMFVCPQQPLTGNGAGPWGTQELLHKLTGLLSGGQVSVGRLPARKEVQVYPASQGPYLITGTSALICKILDKTKRAPAPHFGEGPASGQPVHLVRPHHPQPPASCSSLQGCIPLWRSQADKSTLVEFR